MRKVNVFETSFYVALLVFVFSCQKDKVDITPSPVGFPDAIIKFDPKVGGVFEGDKTTEFPDDIEPQKDLDTNFKDNETNSLSKEVINQAPDFFMEDFVVAYDKVLSAFPGINQSSNEFAEKVIENIAKGTDPGGKKINPGGRIADVKDVNIYDQFSKLTPEEKSLVLRNPVKAYKSRTAARSAVMMTISLFGENGYKTRSDAFRHSYWNWLMSECCSVEWARAFANAHESQTPNDDDKRMDLNNNMIGRRVFVNNPSASESEAQRVLLDYKLLWLNEEQKNVVVGIDYLVYLSPIQSLTVFDDGPSYDDIYEILWDGRVLGTTPEGGSKAFEFSQIPSDTYSLKVRCLKDGTKGGCGFQIILKGAMRLSSGQSQSPQIVINESGEHSAQLSFPVINVRRID